MIFFGYERNFVNRIQEQFLGAISTELTSISAGLHSGRSIGVGLHSGCPCLLEVGCCFVFGLRQLLGGPSTSVGAARVVVSSVGSCCLIGLMG